MATGQWSVVVLRSALADLRFPPESRERAVRRAEAQVNLHSCPDYVEDGFKNELIVNASSYYARKHPTK